MGYKLPVALDFDTDNKLPNGRPGVKPGRGSAGEDGRMHPTYLLDGTETGRPSCVAKGTFIEVLHDVGAQPLRVPIEDVKVGDLVYSYTALGDLRIKPVVAAWSNGRKRVVRVSWKGASQRLGFVDLTPEHLVWRMYGDWVPASELRAGDNVLSLRLGVQQIHTILSVELLPEEVEVYDLTVDGTHNFIANEICVHNCHAPNLFNMKSPEECDSCSGKGCENCDFMGACGFP